MTVAGATLAVAASSNTPKDDIVIFGTEGVTLGVFTLSETNNAEDLELNRLTIASTGSTGVSMYYLYAEGITEAVATRPTPGEFIVPNDTVVIPANDSIDVTIKADVIQYAGTALSNDDPINVAISGLKDIKVTGVSSGSTQSECTVTATGKNFYAYKSRPYFSVNSASPKGENLTPGTYTTVAIFDVTADEGGDIAFNDDITGDDHQIKIKVNAHVTSTPSADNYVYFRLWNATDGEALGYDSVELSASGSSTDLNDVLTFDSTNSWSTGRGNDLTIGKGDTKVIKVQATTSDFTADADFIMITLEDDPGNTNGNCIFSIDNIDADYNEGDFIFDGDIAAYSVSAP